MSVLALASALVANGIYQATRKPSELLFPVSDWLDKTPAETWRSYAPLFREFSTASISPELLAALAQTEASGNPVARTYWRWSLGGRWLDWYRPASSSVGLYQMTDATFAEAKTLCIRHHVVLAKSDPLRGRLCDGDEPYFRVLPRHAVQLTAAYLDRYLNRDLAQARGNASATDRRHLAALIHLCGAGAGEEYARQGFRWETGQRCGAEDPRAYLARVDAYERQFRALAAGDSVTPTDPTPPGDERGRR